MRSMAPAIVLAALLLPLPAALAAGPQSGPAFVPPAAGEHPRLFFRRSDLPALKQRAKTPEGQAIIARLKATLGGGDAIPRKAPKAHHGRDDLATWTLYHAMAFGFLWHLTGEQKYADLSKQAMDLAYSGEFDETARAYSWKKPESYLRAGPSIAAVAMAYDLCYDCWPPDYRQKVARDLLTYDVKGGAYRITMEQLARGGNHGPESNHHGSALGGAGLAMLAIRGDEGVDQALVEQYLKTVQDRVDGLFKNGMGESGWFWESPGPGQIASDTSLIPMLQAFRVAGGTDYAAQLPGVKALALRWAAWLMPDPDSGQPIFGHNEPNWVKGGYGGRILARAGLSRGGQFAQGFGLLTNPDEKAALLWVYQNFVEPSELKDPDYTALLSGQPSYDAMNLPHRAVLSFVNWPIGIAPKNPAGIVPRTATDRTRMGYSYFRKGWKDANDIFVGVLTGSRGGAKSSEDILVWGLGGRYAFALARSGAPEQYRGYSDGSGMVAHRGSSVAVDYGPASGADAVIVVAGPAASTFKTTRKSDKVQTTTVTLGGQPCVVLVMSSTGKFPTPAADGDRLTVGGQTFTLQDGALAMAKTAN